MTDGDALLAAILAAPADDAPRWAFADWLDETGHTARAAFVRGQLAHPPRLGDALKKRVPLAGRWADLLDRPVWELDHGRVTTPSVVVLGNKGRSYVGFERGFAAWAYLPWGEWHWSLYVRAFAGHPLARIDIEQACVTPWAGARDMYGFQGGVAGRAARAVGTATGDDLLANGGPYPSPAAAKGAMSAGLVRWARAVAGLGELP